MKSEDKGGHWSTPVGINLGKYNGTSVGPGRGLQLSDQSPAPGRILFIGHHGAYQVHIYCIKSLSSFNTVAQLVPHCNVISRFSLTHQPTLHEQSLL